MSDPSPANSSRSDAQRNRKKLISAARTIFSAGERPVSLEAIAREAGVGIGTLYRHFPTREALIEAVYATELDELTDSVPVLLEALPPDEALRAWLERQAAFAATKRGMLDMLRAGGASGNLATPATRERITTAIATILAAGTRTGSLRADVAAEDVAAMLLGVSTAAASNPEQTGRLLDLVLDALRPQGPTSQ